MFPQIKFLLLICIISIQACSLLETKPELLLSEINLWLEQNEFDKIEASLEKIDPNDKRYSNILSKSEFIHSRKKYFINQTISSAKNQQQSNNWQLALDTYNSALEKVKNNRRINEEKIKLLAEIDNQVNKLGKDLLMQRANALISYKKIYTKLNKLIPNDYSAQFDIKRYDKDRLEVAHQLNSCGDLAIKNKQLIQARNCYTLSNKLEPSEKKQSLVTNINLTLKQKTNITRNSNLLSAYKTAYKNKDYNSAKRHLTTLLSVTPNHTKAKKQLSSLNKEIEKLITQKTHQGEILYNKKKINAALNIWKQALQLEPNNKKLNQLISRAEKVSKNILSLQQHQ